MVRKRTFTKRGAGMTTTSINEYIVGADRDKLSRTTRTKEDVRGEVRHKIRRTNDRSNVGDEKGGHLDNFGR